MRKMAMRAIIGIVNIVIATSAIYLKSLNGDLHWILANVYREMLDANLDLTSARKIVGINHDMFFLTIILALSATAMAAILAHSEYYGRKTGRVIFSVCVISLLISLIMF